MIFRSFAGKIWLTIVAWVFLVLLIFGGILAKSTHDFYYGYAAEENEELTDTAVSLSGYLASLTDIQAAAQEFGFLGNLLKYDVMAVDTKGKVVLSTGTLRDWSKSTMSEADMEQLKQGRLISFEGSTPYVNKRTLKVATPVMRDGKFIGAVFVFEPMNYLTAVGRSVNSSIGWGLILSFLLAIPAGLLLARRMAHPVVEMDRAVKDIATGNYSRLLKIDSADELASLGQSVNTLSEEIRLQLDLVTRERQQLANILTSIEDGVLTLSPAKEIIIANRVAQEQFATGRDGAGLSLADLPQSLSSFLQEALTSRTSLQGEFAWGDEVYSVETSPLLTYQEQGGLVAVWHNVTKERQLEALRKEFVANVSHELRTPLSYLQGYTEALLDGVISDEQQRKRYLETILNESLRLRRLVNDLLDLSKIEYGGSLELPHESVSVPYVVGCIQQQISPVAEQREVSLVLDLEPNLPPVDCGIDRVKQILLNLMDNALRFSSPGGTISIAARVWGEMVEISVADQGEGIPEEEQQHIWDRFVGAKHGNGLTTGTGIGLAIVKSLVQAYRGQVGLSSKPGRGSTFYVRLPKAKLAG